MIIELGTGQSPSGRQGDISASPELRGRDDYPLREPNLRLSLLLAGSTRGRILHDEDLQHREIDRHSS